MDYDAEYEVVVNDEGQQSVWARGRTVPAGWRSTGDTGDRQECLARIAQVWTDMRPLSRRTPSSG